MDTHYEATGTIETPIVQMSDWSNLYPDKLNKH